jgi:NitT/TauT family transport system substrate-binding protein
VIPPQFLGSGVGHKGNRFRSIFFFPLFLFLVFGGAEFFDGRAAEGVSEPLKQVILLLDWYPQAENAGYICAKVNGYYHDAGFEVEIRPMSMGAASPPFAQAVTGKIQYFMDGADQVLVARSNGFPVKCVMATMQHCPIALLVHAESPVKSFSDLEGHDVSAATGFAWFPYILKKYHLQHVGERRFTGANATFAIDPTCIQQCLVTSEPYFMERQGIKVRTLMVKDSGFDPYRVLVTSDQYLASDPAGVRAFVAASIEGWRTYLKDPARTDAEILKLNPEMSQGQLDYSRRTLIEGHYIDGYRDQGEAIGQITPARMESLYHIMREVGVLQHDFDFRSALSPDLLKPGT